MADQPLIQVEASLTFNRNLRALSKKYRNIKNDIQPVIEQLQRGELLGDQIPGIRYTVFKLRVRNSDTQKGKSGGYRLIYYVKTVTGIILLTIYAKSEQADIETEEIRSAISEYERRSSEDKGGT
ncbi:type II toxin-antitoxin system RelE/ParE family toxin [Leptolyngbya sp. FACHB-711]|uniref:type II toxin-antitoxin system RelE/ParE family toxin n=1 Tax=unclassified Leptolyngbya TaxID=2650499 RepID=UPI001681D081|nr:type II toxin-antitoxin system RelE/ParE family toxin [Leptolyngbya sp. FACHB-711]MBD1850804.1 type II toxin-antitoxin system RelE/ParE family toxin [Cyanobacteria bacterium FACHB-502]MBD2023504.1 type II toxin-antitoxin system RelE/ParE family toxin [Leptolyngbya sp. FACHB-711]